VSESLRVALNEGAVHAIDAPDEATVRGPFHVVLANRGGPVHVLLDGDDDLSAVARIDETNHYVEGGETSRIPIGVVPEHAPARGVLEIVTGYGAETTRVDLTFVDDGPTTADDGAEETVASEASAAATHTGASGSGGTANRSRSRQARQRSRPTRSSRGTATFFDDTASTLLAQIGLDSRERLAFLGVVAVALVVGLAVITAVGEILLSLLVVAIVTAAVAIAGWLLIE
jgi:hypothetical protein